MKIDLSFNIEEVFLDIEPLDNKPNSPIIELSLISISGEILFNELINPGGEYELNDYKKNVLGFSKDKLKHAKDINYYLPCLKKLTKDVNVVAYGKSDLDKLPWLKENSIYSDCCQRFSDRYGVYSKYHGNHTWISLADACSIIGYSPKGAPHRSLTDAESCRQVWISLDSNNVDLISPFTNKPKGNLISLPKIEAYKEENIFQSKGDKKNENTIWSNSI